MGSRYRSDAGRMGRRGGQSGFGVSGVDVVVDDEDLSFLFV